MNGVGQPFLPNPSFSSANPFWFDPAEKYPFLFHDYRPRPTAHDFLYATTWEIWRRDTHLAYCIRSAMQRTVKLNWHVGIARQLLKSTQKETHGEKIS